MKKTYRAKTAEELKNVARMVVKDPLSSHMRIFLFCGALGAGKTTCIQGLAESLQAHTPPTSPTYSLVHEYALPGDKMLFHIDLYRITNDSELAPIGLQDIMRSANAILCVEWPDAFMKFFSRVPHVVCTITQKKHMRLITVEWLLV